MLLLLGAARRAIEGDGMVRRGEWNFWSPAFMVGTQVTGKRLGILGMGRVVPQVWVLGTRVHLLQPMHGCIPAQALAQQVQRLIDLVDYGLGIGLHVYPRA